MHEQRFMLRPMKRLVTGLALLIMVILPFSADAYVSVSGYTKKNGTYVAPYVRSNPNGLKYDNYSWTPSQGLYNKTYGTRGAYWDTPTYKTDPNYYTGLSLYNAGSPGYTTFNGLYDYDSLYTPTYSSYLSPYTPTYSYLSGASYQTVSGGHKSYGILFCDYGYYESYDTCIKAPTHSTAYGLYSFYCDFGYTKVGSSCVKDAQDSSYSQLLSNYFSTYTGSYTGSYVDNPSAYSVTVAQCPEHAHNSTINASKCICDSGYQMNSSDAACIVIPTASAGSNDLVCQSSYGMGSKWDGTITQEGKIQCGCVNGYVWNTSKNACFEDAGLSSSPVTSDEDNKLAGENYYRQNKTCAGLNYTEQYSYCISYAYNH